jgi:hypothetical protein
VATTKYPLPTNKELVSKTGLMLLRLLLVVGAALAQTDGTRRFVLPTTLVLTNQSRIQLIVAPNGRTITCLRSSKSTSVGQWYGRRDSVAGSLRRFTLNKHALLVSLLGTVTATAMPETPILSPWPMPMARNECLDRFKWNRSSVK